MDEDLGNRHPQVRRNKSCGAVYSVPNATPAVTSLTKAEE